MSNIWIFVISHVYLTSQPLSVSFFRSTKFNFGHCRQTFQPNSFVGAILIGAIDFYGFISVSLTLTLAGGHKGQHKAEPTGFFCNTHFS